MEFEPSVKQAEIDHGQRLDGLTTDEKQELARLRRGNKQLRLLRRLCLEREILAKATALRYAESFTWFARETGSVPPKSSSS